jgi:hypothetical protein
VGRQRAVREGWEPSGHHPPSLSVFSSAPSAAHPATPPPPALLAPVLFTLEMRVVSDDLHIVTCGRHFTREHMLLIKSQINQTLRISCSRESINQGADTCALLACRWYAGSGMPLHPHPLLKHSTLLTTQCKGKVGAWRPR